ncbi:MAG: SDR family oxidoreductase [Planctomycetes bacterium]|nr:SDR family oxidoreductase [Planctomycetota bacterium]
MNETYLLTGRHALVCGASSGIGRATALALASHGAQITALARSGDKLGELIPELEAAGASGARALKCDLSLHDSVQDALDRLVLDVGPVHILINNAGGPRGGPILNASAEEFTHAFHLHVLTAHLLTRSLLPGMTESGFGRIVNIISTSVKEPIAGLGVSNTIRAAMAAWAKTVSKELPSGVTINNVLPGFTATDRLSSLKEQIAERRSIRPDQVEEEWLSTVPEGRLARPEEVAALAAFLCTPAAAYVRGQSIAADGGRLNSI